MNVILVMSDTYRYDNLSCYRPARVKTPRLDQFAGQAHVFDNAYLSSFPTIPNRLDLMNGRFNFTTHEWCPLPLDVVTLQQVLSASGVTTYLIADNPHLVEMGFHYDRGYDAFEWIRGQETDRWQTSPREIKMPPVSKNRSPFILKTYLRNRSWWQREEDWSTPRVIRAACDWLERNQDQDKFFLHLDLFDPHEPWDAPQKYLDLYEQGYTGPDIPFPYYNFWRDFLTEEEMNHVRALYMAEASMVDHWFGVLLDKIDELGLTEDTIVIFASDHGYLFGEHDLTGKSLMPEVNGRMHYEAIRMYDEIRRVPLLVRMPGQTEGRRIKALVQSPDLTPTILEMAGLVATETMGGESRTQALQCGVFYTDSWQFNPDTLHGRSLMPLIRGETERLRDIAVSSNTLIHHTPILAKGSVVTEDGWCLHYAGNYDDLDRDASMWISKLIDPKGARIPTEPALFYLPDDPQELHDVIDQNEGLATEIHRRYVAWLEEHGTPEEHLAGRRKLR